MKHKTNNLQPKPPTKPKPYKDTFASISASISASVSGTQGKLYEQKLKHWEMEKKYWQKYLIDTERISQTKNLGEFLGLAKDILPEWSSSGSEYYPYLYLAVRKRAEIHRKERLSIPHMPSKDDGFSVRLWLDDAEKALPVNSASLNFVLDNYQVSRRTVMRYIKNRRLHSYRPEASGKTSEHILDVVEVAKCGWPRRRRAKKDSDDTP